jgi:hypothetical protein
MDENMTYAINEGNIWKFDFNQSKYINYLNSSLEPISNTTSSNNRLVVVSRNRTGNSTKLLAIVFVDTPNGLRPFFNFSGNYLG